MKSLNTSFLFFCLVQICFCNTSCISQNYSDTLKTYFKKSKDSNRSFEAKIKDLNKVIIIAKNVRNNKYLLKAYNRKSFIFYSKNKYDSAIFNAQLLLDKSIETNNISKLTLAYKKLADCYRKKNNFILSIEFYEKHKKNSVLKKDFFSVINDLRYIASLQKKIGFVFESEKSAIEALKLVNDYRLQDRNLKEVKLALYNHLGTLYREKESYIKALEYYDRALLIASKESYINSIHNNKANVYLDQEKYDEALIIFQELYQKAKQLKNNKKVAKALSNLGITQAKVKNPKALANLLESLRIRKNEDDISEQYASYIHLAEYYEDKRNNKKVFFYANKAYNIATNLGHDTKKVKALSYFVNLNEDFQIVEYYRLRDRMAKEKKHITNKYAALKYDFEVSEKILKRKQAKERFYKMLFLSIGILILMIYIFTVVILNSKNKKEKLEQVYITETRISQKVHDEVANDIFGMMTKLQVNERENAIILDDLERVYVKTRDISKENSIIDFTENFDEVLQDLLMSYQNDTVNVITRNLNKIDWKSISKLKKIAVYRVLQELMTNMKKHSKATITIISFEEKNKKLHINYRDNGIGCTLNKNTGLQNTENRIQSVEGSIIFESQTNKGFDVKMTI